MLIAVLYTDGVSYTAGAFLPWYQQAELTSLFGGKCKSFGKTTLMFVHTLFEK